MDFGFSFNRYLSNNMIRRTSSVYKRNRGWLFVVLAATLVFMAYAVPPDSFLMVVAFILLATAFITTLFSFFLRLRDSLLIAVTAGLILALNAYFGVNILNTVLLISFVLGLRFLVQ